MSKHAIEIDEAALAAARSELGTRSIEDTVNAALRLVASERADRVRGALDVLATHATDRLGAWR